MPNTARRRTAPAPLATPRPRPVLVAQADPITCPNCGDTVDAHGSAAGSARAELDQHGVYLACHEDFRMVHGDPDAYESLGFIRRNRCWADEDLTYADEDDPGIPGRDW